MSREKPVVVVVVRHATSPQRLGWLRRLLPAALLVLPEMLATSGSSAERVFTLDAEVVESGPLAVADALTRGGAAGAAHPRG